jgi:hypothetical protein
MVESHFQAGIAGRATQMGSESVLRADSSERQRPQQQRKWILSLPLPESLRYFSS